MLFPGSTQADHPLGDKLGTISFSVSGKPEAQAHVVRGVKLVHHMMYPEADREFARAAEIDPACALAWWGRAMTIIRPLWPDVPTEADRRRGSDFIQRGLACPPATARERAYLETLNVYFTTEGNHEARLKAADVAWGRLADAYPDDLDAVAFSALYHLAPARFVPADKSNRIQLAAAMQIEKVLARIPDHPGGQHYKIHALDFPLLAGRALEVCDAYGSIAPEVPHALHMPTHIFTRRGIWDKSIEYNRRSADAARKLGEETGAMNGHYPHALDYMAYAYLQRGQYRGADAVRRELFAITGPYSPVMQPAMAFAFAAVPARYALERQAWSEAAALGFREPSAFPWGNQYLYCDSIVRFARALGAARSGKLDAARAEIAELERIGRELAAGGKVAYWISQAETQLLAARAWTLLAEKKPGEALPLMRKAVELEMNVDKEAVTPGEVLPAGDLLGDMLLELQRPAEALAAFEAVLAASPNRLNTLYGAGLSAERAGRKDKAREYFQQLVTVAGEADRGIARVEYARAFLGGRTANAR